MALIQVSIWKRVYNNFGTATDKLWRQEDKVLQVERNLMTIYFIIKEGQLAELSK